MNQRACCLGADWSCTRGPSTSRATTTFWSAPSPGGAEPVAAVRAMHNVLGGTVDPHAAWLLLRGLKTLVRNGMEEISQE